MKTNPVNFTRNRLGLAVVAATLAASSGMAQAVPVELKMQMVCPFPLIPPQNIAVKVTADYPTEIPVGEPLGPIHITSVSTVTNAARGGLAAVNATTVTGTAMSFNTFRTVNGDDISQNTELTVTPTAIPKTSGTFDVPAEGDAAAITFNDSQIGPVSLTVDSLTLNMKNLKADGSVAPGLIGQFTANCTLAAGSPNVLASLNVVEGSGGPGPVDDPQEIEVSTAALDFGSLQLGQSATQTVTVSNQGDLPLGVNAVTISGAGAASFTQTNNCTSVAGGSSCTVNVTYTASEEGAKAASVVIESDDADESRVTVALTGSGQVELKPEIDVSLTPIDFGSIDVGTTASKALTISNSGGAALDISSVALSNNDDFQIASSNCNTVAAGGSCTVNLSYTASSSAVANDTLTILSNDGDEASAAVSLTGKGQDVVVEPGLEIVLAATGSTYVAASGGTLPLKGDIVSIVDLSTGLFTGEMHLAPTSGTFEVLKGSQLVKATANIEFEPVGLTEGSLIDGKLTATTAAYVKVPKVYTKIFGIPVTLGGGANCRTVAPVTFTVATPDGEFFDPFGGGVVKGTYTLPALENCGTLTSILSQKLAGPNNTISLELKADLE